MDLGADGEYLDALELLPKGINVGSMVGHCAVRYHAMGDRALGEATAGEADLTAMSALVDEAISAGALGFSTSRTLRHRVPDGRFVPGTWARTEELLALAEVPGSHGRGVIEVSPRFDGEGPAEPRVEAELAWMRVAVVFSLASGSPRSVTRARASGSWPTVRRRAAGMDSFFVVDGLPEVRYGNDPASSLAAVAQRRGVTPARTSLRSSTRVSPPTCSRAGSASAGCWIQRGTGYDATVVNGRAAFADGAHTGVHAGTVLRSRS